MNEHIAKTLSETTPTDNYIFVIPNPSRTRFATTCTHLNAPKPQLDPAAKDRLGQGDSDTKFACRQLHRNCPVPEGPSGRFSRLPFNGPVCIFIPLLPKPWIMHVRHANASGHLGVTHTLKIFGRFYWWGSYGSLHNMVVVPLPEMPDTRTDNRPVLPILLPNSAGVSISVEYFEPQPTMVEVIHVSYSSQIASGAMRICTLSSQTNSQ